MLHDGRCWGKSHRKGDRECWEVIGTLARMAMRPHWEGGIWIKTWSREVREWAVEVMGWKHFGQRELVQRPWGRACLVYSRKSQEKVQSSWSRESTKGVVGDKMGMGENGYRKWPGWPFQRFWLLLVWFGCFWWILREKYGTWFMFY